MVPEVIQVEVQSEQVKTFAYLQPFDHFIVADFVRYLFDSGRIADLAVARRFLLLRKLHGGGRRNQAVFYWPLWAGKQKFSGAMLQHLQKTNFEHYFTL